MPEQHLIDVGLATLSTFDHGPADARPLVCVASLGRGHVDFEPLADALQPHGLRLIAVDLRGIGDSSGPLDDGLALHDLAADVAGVIASMGLATPVDVLGHAFGNRVVRMLATDRPDLVRSVTLVAAGGRAAPVAEASSAFQRFLADYDLGQRPASEQLADVKRAHFAAASSGEAWMKGWHVAASRSHSAASRATPVETWWEAGTAPLLVVQGLEDEIAPPANGRMLMEALGERVSLVELENAGHALLVEQPEAVATALAEFLAT
jgi:pimeloyl-ACP methyl ester carboxylesterase